MNKFLPALSIAALLLTGCSAAGTATQAGGSASAAASTSATAQVTDSEYAVAIVGSHQTKDYEGNRTLVVDFTFKNNSDKAATFLVAVSAKAFQNGVELERAIVGDDKKYEAGSSMKEIKTGASLKVQEAYVLSDKSDVTVEVSELISFDDSLIASKTIAVK